MDAQPVLPDPPAQSESVESGALESERVESGAAADKRKAEAQVRASALDFGVAEGGFLRGHFHLGCSPKILPNTIFS